MLKLLEKVSLLNNQKHPQIYGTTITCEVNDFLWGFRLSLGAEPIRIVPDKHAGSFSELHPSHNMD